MAGKNLTGSATGRSENQFTISVGRFTVAMSAPLEPDEPEDRISCWWGVTSASVVLSEYLAASQDLGGLTAVELGCGLGLAGITAAKMGAHVVFTDYSSDALAFAGRNSALNGVESAKTSFLILDWDKPAALEPVDLLLGAEILYDYFFHGSLIHLAHEILKDDGTLLLADRKRLVVTRFVGRLVSSGFRCSQISTVCRHEGFPNQEITIYRLDRCRHAPRALTDLRTSSGKSPVPDK